MNSLLLPFSCGPNTIWFPHDFSGTPQKEEKIAQLCVQATCSVVIGQGFKFGHALHNAQIRTLHIVRNVFAVTEGTAPRLYGLGAVPFCMLYYKFLFWKFLYLAVLLYIIHTFIHIYIKRDYGFLPQLQAGIGAAGHQCKKWETGQHAPQGESCRRLFPLYDEGDVAGLVNHG